MGYIDTADAACAIPNAPDEENETPIINIMRLKRLLLKLGFVAEGCHVGGNDANFTLRALLLLAIEGFNQSGSSKEHATELLERIRLIALNPLP